MEKHAEIVIKIELFSNIDFSSILAPFWEVLGEVLGGFGEVLGSLEASKTRQTRCRKVNKGQYGPGRRFGEALKARGGSAEAPKTSPRGSKSAPRGPKMRLAAPKMI